ncbi:PDZ domain-containing protein [Antricoccus suffuscus]|uniref:PDZ domain-containing protein n=1 Tax=Antricoccus suffuscus TaxID=1629062 RepID=A0A2T0ZQD9_9ACTN|nr:S16 family serine protease [Antricoccus suffuscus]PRZ38535.1 PDZ domain-containing protein [Antricoccus suffuscus]
MSRRFQTLCGGVVVLAVLLLIVLTVKVPFVAEVPGPTANTIGKYDGKQVIKVDGDIKLNKSSGNLNLTTVGIVENLTVFQAIEGWFDDGVSVVPTEVIYPPNVSREATDKQNKADYDNSENFAVAAALGHLGYPTKVVVVTPPKGSDLKSGDAIDSVGGTAITSFADLQGVLKTIAPDTAVEVGYQHFGVPATTSITTQKPTGKDAGSGGSRLGVTVNARPYAPFNVTFAQNDIGGPSAGLMLTLGVLDLVGPKSITGGHFIAGTGTIDAEGKVGPIGGIRLKMKKAAEVGADIFLAPAKNCAEAMTDPPANLKVAKIDSLDSALDTIAKYNAGEKFPTC